MKHKIYIVYENAKYMDRMKKIFSTSELADTYADNMNKQCPNSDGFYITEETVYDA